MAEASIPVDLFNPGQVFACLGFLETADVLLSDAEGGFDWSNEADVRFLLRAPGEEDPIEAILAFLATATVRSLAPFGSANRTDGWGIETIQTSIDEPFPFRDPPSPATLPAVLAIPSATTGAADSATQLVIDHWGDSTSRDAVKFWSGLAGKPGAAIAQDALDLVRNACRDAVDDPLNMQAPQASSFRFDWRRDYIPTDIGFSLNSHNGGIRSVGFPIVEIFAALGLRDARPKKINVLEYTYAVIGGEPPTYHPSLIRAALGDADLPLLRRRFRMHLGWPAQEGKARCITSVTEEEI